MGNMESYKQHFRIQYTAKDNRDLVKKHAVCAAEHARCLSRWRWDFVSWWEHKHPR